MDMEIKINSLDSIHEAAKQFIAAMGDNTVFAFYGKMGAGKTTFIKAVCEELGVTDVINSPTFAIVNYYRGPRPFAHFDLYRIHTEGDLAAAGFYDYLDMGAVVACEWSENCAELLDLENPLRIHIERVDETTRKITIQ